MTQGQDRLDAMAELMKDGYTRGQAKAMTFWMSMPATTMADVAKSEPPALLATNKYPQEPPPHCPPNAWQYCFDTYPESVCATEEAMWRYFFEVADMLRVRAERRAEGAEIRADEAERDAEEVEAECRTLRNLLAGEENACEEAEGECRGLRAQHAQDVEVIRSLQEQLKEKDEEITALRHCVDDEQANVARSKEAFLNMQQKFIQAQATILELRKPPREE